MTIDIEAPVGMMVDARPVDVPGVSVTDQHETEAPVVDIPVIDMVRPMPGFPQHRRFGLVRLAEGSDLCSFSSLDERGLRFLVVPPSVFFPDYAPVVGDDVVEDLDIRTVSEVMVLLVLNAGGSLADTTANLAAPLLINTRNQRAAQVVLDEVGLPVAAPLLGS